MNAEQLVVYGLSILWGFAILIALERINHNICREAEHLAYISEKLHEIHMAVREVTQ